MTRHIAGATLKRVVSSFPCTMIQRLHLLRKGVDTRVLVFIPSPSQLRRLFEYLEIDIIRKVLPQFVGCVTA